MSAETKAPNGAPPESTTPPVDEAGAVAAQPAAATTLFGTDDPAVAMQRAQAAAAAVKSALDSSDFTSAIKGKKHVKVEGWQLIGSMFGASAVLDWMRPIADPAKGWEARFQVELLGGRVIGAGEAQCDRNESKWKTSDDHAVRSMAQTRATSKALASVFRFIATLAGFSGTPAEEMPPNGLDDGSGASTQQQPPSNPGPKIPGEKVIELGKGIGALGLSYRELAMIFTAIGAPWVGGEDADGIRRSLENLTLDQATAMEARMEAVAQDKAATASQDEGEG